MTQSNQPLAISEKVRSAMEESSWIRHMFEQGAALKQKYGDDNVFDLSLGNPVIEPPKEFNDTLLRLTKYPSRGMHRYMPNAGYPETRAAVARTLAQNTQLPVTLNEVVMTVGAAGALNVIAHTILNPGDEVIILTPYFAEYVFYIRHHGGVPRPVSTDNRFLPDLAAIDRALSPKTRAILVNSPNNPTGVVYPESIMKELGILLERKSTEWNREIFLVSDEPYSKLLFDDLRYPHPFHSYRRSIIATSYSKELALPGERIGYIAVHPDYEARKSLIDGFVFCNRTLGFVSAPALMQRAVTELQEVTIDVQLYQAKRDLLYDALTNLGYKMPRPQGAFYMFPESPTEDDLEFVEALLKYNVLVVPGRGFGQKGHFRISYCVEDDVLKGAIEGFRRVLTDIHAPASQT